MRIPPLDETQKHLAGAGYALRHRANPGDGQGSLELLEAKGYLRETFNDLLDFWVYWMHFAARVLTQEERIQKVVYVYRAGSGPQRAKLAEDLEAYLRGVDGTPIELLFDQVESYSALRLPRNWKKRLINNLNGEMPNPWFNTEVIDALIAVDPGLGERWSNPNNIYCVPVDHPNVMLGLPQSLMEAEHGMQSCEPSASPSTWPFNRSNPARSSTD